mgnify:CR=1 FL=1
MPKYYVRDCYERHVVDADNPTEAIIKALLHYFNGFVVNGTFIVSEQGFEPHPEDLIFESNYILDYLGKKIDEKRKKDKDDT